ncbi:MAG: PEGA domain-containing protein [Methanolinea sp.]|nr:PEGA domain-containing protein [Methanolinea sp.]
MRFLMAVLVAGFFLAVLPAGAEPIIGGDQAWYAVHCNVDGASVYFDGEYKGEIQGNVLNVPVYTTGTPYKTYSVQKEGYTTFSDSIPGVPGKGETFDLYATLNPTQPTQPPLIGGDIGWFAVHCNVDGASVAFDNTPQGVITNGILTVQVYTTATPFRTYTVTMPGYQPYTGTIDRYPGKGETVDLYATLNPVPTPTPTKSPLLTILVLVAVGAAGLLAVRRKE